MLNIRVNDFVVLGDGEDMTIVHVERAVRMAVAGSQTVRRDEVVRRALAAAGWRRSGKDAWTNDGHPEWGPQTMLEAIKETYERETHK